MESISNRLDAVEENQKKQGLTIQPGSNSVSSTSSSEPMLAQTGSASTSSEEPNETETETETENQPSSEPSALPSSQPSALPSSNPSIVSTSKQGILLSPKLLFESECITNGNAIAITYSQKYNAFAKLYFSLNGNIYSPFNTGWYILYLLILSSISWLYKITGPRWKYQFIVDL